MAMANGANHRPDPEAWIKSLLGCFIGNHFNGPNQAFGTGFTGERMIGQSSNPRIEQGGDFLNMAKDVPLVINFQRFKRHRRANGMAGIGIAVAKTAEVIRLLGDGLKDSSIKKKTSIIILGARGCVILIESWIRARA